MYAKKFMTILIFAAAFLICYYIYQMSSYMKIEQGKFKRMDSKVNSSPRFDNFSFAQKEVKNIFFLKTHKTGSCTVQNIMFRFGDNRNLTFLLENIESYGYPAKFKTEKVYPLDLSKMPSKQYNIVCRHMRFDYKEIKKVMNSKTVYITILRNPEEAFPSALRFFYVDFKRCLKLNSSKESAIKEFITKFDRLTEHKNCLNDVPVRNHAAFDLGIDFSDMDNSTSFKEKIREMDKIFSLVLITEYFDESLILLKSLLGWKFEDVVYLKHNVMKKTTTRQTLSKDDRQKIRQWNNADLNLYEYFNKTLWRKVKEYGESKLRKEVMYLRNLNLNWYNNCVKREVKSKYMTKGDNKPFYDDIFGFVLNAKATNNTTCIQLTRQEKQYSDKIKDKMLKLMNGK